MLQLDYLTPAGDTRTVALPAAEPDLSPVSLDLPALATFQLRTRDTLDFSVDFSAWLAANGAATLSNPAWSVSPMSPAVPTIVSQNFTAAGRALVVIAAPVGAKIQDAYWLDVVASIAGVAGDTPIPARVLTRQIRIVLVQG